MISQPFLCDCIVAEKLFLSFEFLSMYLLLPLNIVKCWACMVKHFMIDNKLYHKDRILSIIENSIDLD